MDTDVSPDMHLKAWLQKIVVALFFFLPVSLVSAEEVIFINPVWGDIDQEGPPNSVSGGVATEIAVQGSTETLSAFKFCEALGYQYVSYLVGGTVNPSVVWRDDEWRDAGRKDDFLQIICEDGVVSSTTDVVVQVDIPPYPDYTMFLKYFFILFSSVFFGLVVVYFNSLVNKFTS
jgi:hypothetical protein